MAQNGGRREGAGRRGIAKELKKQAIADEVFPDELEIKTWRELIESQDLDVRLSAAKFWSEQKHGKAYQAIGGKAGGPLEVVLKFALE